MKRPKLAVLFVLAGVASAVALPYAFAASGGGLGTSPAIFERVAQPGKVGVLSIANTSPRAMDITIAARPWVQARNGVVSPDRRRTLGSVRLSATKFLLKPGGTRQVNVSLARTPSSGSLYGNVEVLGVPTGKIKRGIKVAYRLVSNLRLNPSAGRRVRRVRVGNASVARQGQNRIVRVAVLNTGNTVDPIGGTVRITGGVFTVSGSVTPTRIVPGAIVDLELASLTHALPAGRYKVSGRLTQGGRAVAKVKRTIRLR